MATDPFTQAVVDSLTKVVDTEVIQVPVSSVNRTPLDTDAGLKYDSSKPDYSLLSSVAIDELSKVLTFGKQKYAAHNWRKGIQISRLVAAALRHLFALLRGETYDPETGLQHAAHAMCCCMFIIETLVVRPEQDDRYVVDVSSNSSNLSNKPTDK